MGPRFSCHQCRRPFESFERIHFVRWSPAPGQIERVGFCLDCCASDLYPLSLRHNPRVFDGCAACGGPPGGDMALERVRLRCPTCAAELVLSPIEIDPLTGLATVCPGCHECVSVGPGAVCRTCDRWLAPQWQREVRAAAPSDQPHELIDNSDGTITDYRTGLVWQKASDGERRAFADAVDYCERLSLRDHWDWRLPTVEELRSIVLAGHRPAVDDRLFPTAPDGRYWTRTEYLGQPEVAYTVDFASGGAEVSYEKHYGFHARACRRP
jgi:hypothetical protein